jgi:hypothetical protein
MYLTVTSSIRHWSLLLLQQRHQLGAVCWPQASGQQGRCAFASCIAAMTGQQGYCCSCPLWGYCQGQHVFMLLLFQTVSE